MSASVKKIMLIDDDPVNNLINRMLIQKIHPEVEINEFLNAKAALDKIQSSFTPDLILLDINMPEMNGWDFIENFRKLEKDIKITILTSSIDYSDYKKSQKYKEVLNYVEKPLNRYKINKLLNGN